MDTLKHFKHLAFVLLAIWALGCSEDKGVTPPPVGSKINLQTISGMPSDDVFDVFVDSKGRLWVSTEAGVGMFANTQGPFDVTKATWFTNREGVPNLRCRGIAELNGKIFVGTWGGGVGIYNDAVPWETIGESEGLVYGRVFDVAADDSSMWIAAVKSLTQYIDDESRPIEDRLINYTNTFGGGGVFSSIIVQNGEVWVSERSTDEGGVIVPGGMRVFRFPGVQYFSTKTSAIPDDDVIEVSYDPGNDLIWSACPSAGVASLDVGSKVWKTLTTGDGLVSNLASSVAVNQLGTKWPKGTVWIATQAGLTKMEPNGNKVNYVEGSGLPNVRVRKVYIDHNDDVWLAFVDRGAAKIAAPK